VLACWSGMSNDVVKVQVHPYLRHTIRHEEVPMEGFGWMHPV
jgi:hypothetical protein